MNFTKIAFEKVPNMKFAPVSEVWQDENSRQYQFVTFDSFNHMVNFVEVNENSGKVRYTLKEEKDSWCFGSLFKNSKDFTRKCLVEGSAPDGLTFILDREKEELYKNNPELFDLNTNARKKKRRRVFREEGSELNIDRYMSGEVEMWENTIKVNKKPVVKLMVSAAISSATDSTALVKNICAAVAFIDIMASAGISVEVWHSLIVRQATTGVTYSTVLTKIKDANDPVDALRLLSSSAPGIFRYFGFRAIDFSMKGSSTKYMGYPADEYLSENIAKMIDIDLTIHAGGHLNRNIKAIINKLKEILI